MQKAPAIAEALQVVAAANESRRGEHQPWRALKRRLVLLIT